MHRKPYPVPSGNVLAKTLLTAYYLERRIGVPKPGGSMVQVKTTETHGYNAVQVGYQVVPERKITKPQLNHLKKSGAPAMRKLKEYRVRAAIKMCCLESMLPP